MLDISFVQNTLSTPGFLGLGVVKPNDSEVYSILASENALGIGSDSYGSSNGCCPSYPGYGRECRPALPLALSPEEKQQAKDRIAAIEGRDDDISGPSCFKKQTADHYREEHNKLMKQLAEQGEGQLVLGN